MLMTVASPCTRGLMDTAHPQAVLSQLNEQRSRGLFCDVTIVVEDVKFRAHRSVLAACSGYFRSAFTASDGRSDSQVLELMDLKSELFANILNFIYTSSVASASTEEQRCLVAAGKSLGIPFLERLVEHESQSSGPPQTKTIYNPIKTPDPSQALVPKKTKKETHRLEEPDSSRGPRITNVFSITEVGPGNDPFSPLVLRSGERQSPDLGHPPTGCPSPCSPAVDPEPKHSLSEHSYAVSQGHRAPEPSQGDDKVLAKPSYTNQLADCNFGPLKKRHRLRGTFTKSILPTPLLLHTTSQTSGGSPSLTNVAETAAVMAPPSLYSEAEAEKSRPSSLKLPLAIDNVQMELDPPTLSPHTEASISIYGCEFCPEIFTNKAILTAHMDTHERERGCPKASADDKQAGEDHNTDSMPDMDNPLTDVNSPPPHLPDLDGLQLNRPKPRLAVGRFVKPAGEQRVYNCSVCKRAYVTLSSLKRHENVHSWQRAYPCHYCNKVFALAEYRTKHEIWHTGERRYQCIFCLETFMTYYILKNHQKSFHGIDPRLAVNRKSANCGFKGSVYPIKLYRLLPMKFRKRRYKTYRQTYTEGGGSDQTPPDCASPIPSSEDSAAMNSADSVLFSMPVTFMATPKTVASVMPRISFDQPCDQGGDQSSGTQAEGGLRRDGQFSSAATREQYSQSNPPCSLISYDFTAQLASTPPDGESLALDSERQSRNMAFLEMMPQSSLNTVNRLNERSAAERRVEAVTNHLFQSGPRSLVPRKAVVGQTETYIAKPACPGPSVDGCVLPLCQITVKIGNEAIIRRRIKGSKLFPRKRKNSQPWSQVESPGLSQPAEGTMECPGSSRRQSTEVTSNVVDPDDDPTDRDVTDQLWRPYYSYKPKKKSKKLSRHRKERRFSYPMAPMASKDYKNTNYRSADESFSSGSLQMKRPLRNSSPKAMFTCNVCSSTFITESGLRAHVIGLHPSFCRICSKQCPPDEAPISETNQAGGEFICESCMENGSCFDNTARSPGSIEKRYRCSVCPQRFLYLATKRSHERKHQETKGYNRDNYTTQPKNTAILHEK